MKNNYVGEKKDLLESERILQENMPNFSSYELTLEEISPIITKIFYLNTNSTSGFNSKTNRTNPRIVKEYEVLLFTKSGGSCVIDQIEYPIIKGDIRIHKPGQIVYSYRYKEAYVIHFAMNNKFSEKDYHPLCKNAYIDKLPPFMPTIYPDKYIQLFEELIRAYINLIGKNQLFIKHKMLELISMLYSDAINFHNDFTINISILEMIKKATEYVSLNYQNNITLKDISQSVNLCPNYFHRVFTRAKNETPLAYLNNYRIERARQLLVTTNFSIAEISERCGFKSPSYFTVVFKKCNLITPNEFRNNNQSEFI